MKKILGAFIVCLGFIGSTYAVDYSCMPHTNIDPVLVAPYGRAPVTGTANFSASTILTGNTYRDYITLGNSYRFRQDGDVTSAKFYFENASGNAQGVYITVWRKIGASYTMVNKSENIIGSLGSTPGIYTVNFAAPLTGVQEGDLYGYRLEANYLLPVVSGGRNFLFAQLPGGTESGTLYYNQSPTFGIGSGFAWTVDGVNVLSNANSVTMEFTMTNPDVALIGDSIIAGHPAHYSYVEKLTKPALSTTIGSYLAGLTSYITHNVGIGGQTTSQISARFAADVLALQPKIIVVEGGVNDIAGGVITSGTFAANVDSMVAAAEAQSGVEKVILVGILPWTNGTNPQNTKVDERNAILSGIAATYSKATYVSAAPLVGQFRGGGPVGNLWDIQAIYNADGVHYNGSGHQKIAEKLLTVMCDAVLPTIVSPGSGAILPNTATIVGTGTSGDVISFYTSTGVLLGTGLVDASGMWTVALPPLLSGMHEFSYRAEDAAGNQTPFQNHTLIIMIPTPVIISPASGSVFNTGTLPVTGTGEVGATIVVTIGATTLTGTVDGSGNWTLLFTGLVDGTQIISAEQIDGAGNVSSSATRPVTIDTAAPVVSLSGQGSLTLTQGGVYSELGALWTDNIDGSGVVAAPYSGSVNMSVPGIYVLYYTYTDGAGNTGNIVTRTVTVVAAPVSGGGGFGGGAGGSSQIQITPTTPVTPIVKEPASAVTPPAGFDVAMITNPTIQEDTCYTRKSDRSIVYQDAVGTEYAYGLTFALWYDLTRYNGTVDFRPSDDMTREEAARLLSEFARNVLCRKPHMVYNASFIDIDGADATLMPYIKDAYELGIFKGHKGLFRPFDKITHQEFASAVMRLLTNTIDVEATNDWWKSYKDIAASLGIFTEKDRTTNAYVRKSAIDSLYRSYRNYDYTMEEVGYVLSY